MDITPGAAVVYYSQQLQRIAQEIQGLGYSLGTLGVDLRSPAGRVPSPLALHNIAGTAARLHSQAGQVLKTVETLMYAAEAAAPKE
jgi:hypothetical protein